MKRFVLGMAALMCAVSGNAQNKAALYDSTQVEQLQEVVVKAYVRRRTHRMLWPTSRNNNSMISQRQVRNCLFSSR